MPMNARNQRTFYKTLYAGMLEAVTLLKRGNDQQEGNVTSHILRGCRWSQWTKTGEPIHEGMMSNHHRELHIPRIELDRIGINYLNPIDRFIDKEGRYWQAESGQIITVKLFQVHICIECVRIDPTGISPAET